MPESYKELENGGIITFAFTDFTDLMEKIAILCEQAIKYEQEYSLEKLAETVSFNQKIKYILSKGNSL